MQKCVVHAFGPWKHLPKMASIEAGVFFFVLTNPDLAIILGRMNFDFDNLYFVGIPHFQIFRFPDSWIPRFPESRLSAGMSRGPLA